MKTQRRFGWRFLATLAAAAAILLTSANAASAATAGGADRIPLLAALQPARLVIVSQGGGPRLLDAHEISSMRSGARATCCT
ncbi:hypothetical protein [Dactylosporangium sp. NPDC006015]|uniref:hypothetical protein n=1 Tax=Dactylosporangium sp. NPDC006015 TaxID=3154576 RepID=UPI0033A6AA3C